MGLLGTGYVHLFKNQLRNVFTIVWRRTFLYFCHKHKNVGTSWFLFRIRLQIRDWRETVELTCDVHGFKHRVSWLIDEDKPEVEVMSTALGPSTNPLFSTEAHMMDDFHIDHTCPREAGIRIMQTCLPPAVTQCPFFPAKREQRHWGELGLLCWGTMGTIHSLPFC